MAKLGTGSWAARAALARRETFTTYGALSATGPERLSWGHRLPADWAELYEDDYDRITYVVWSYSTPIAWVLSDGRVVKVAHKWSVTTTRHQGMLYALDASPETVNSIEYAAERERVALRRRREDARQSRIDAMNTARWRAA